MISALKCRDLGFGFKLSPEQLVTVNTFRANQRNLYGDERAALKVYGSRTKPPLTTSPFITIFDYGKNAEGYWTYDRMVLQLEDCHDVLDALFSVPANDSSEQKHMTTVPNTIDKLKRLFDCCFLFDHSCGHDRKRHDGLDVNGLTKGASAKARKMRSVKIEKEDGILGPYNHPKKLKVGMIQKMVFEEKDNFGNDETGPKLKGTHYTIKDDVIVGTQEVFKTVDEMKAELELHGINSGGIKSQLANKCTNAGISITKTQPKVVAYGWVGKAKGAYQILWERGWIDPNADQDTYTMDGRANNNSIIDKNTSIKHLIRKCEDFVHEKTLLVYHGERLGSIIDRSPKCTPEVAGDGIEYEWAMSKLYYRLQPWNEKKSKDSFTKLVKESVSDKVLTLERARAFSRRARDNMVAYYVLQRDDNNNKAPAPSSEDKYKKTRKTHTSCLDTDKGYVSGLVRGIIHS